MHALLRKDLLCLLRLKSAAAVQVLLVVLLGLTVLATWPQQGAVSIAARRHDDLLFGLMLGQIALLILAIPAHASTVLTAEREQETLEMLYASRLRPWQIVGGKLLSTIAFPLLLLVAAAPFTALLCFRGEVNLLQLAISYAVLAAGSVMIAAVSLAVSAFSLRSQTALAVAYAVILTLCVIAMVPATIMLQERAGAAAAVLHYVRGLSPVAALLSILQPDLFDCGGRVHGLLPLWKVFLPASAVVIAACAAAVSLQLLRPPESITRPARPAARMRSRWRALSLLPRERRGRAVGWLHPVLSKELRTNRLRSTPWMIRIVYGSLCVSIALALMALYGGVEHQDLLNYVVKVLVIFQFIVIAIINPSLTAPVISEEVEVQTLEMLRMSPLRGGGILVGKLVPALPAALMPVLATLPAYLALCFVDPSYVPYLLYLLPVVVIADLLACLIGIACSAVAGSTSRATIAAYVVTALLFAAPLAAWLIAQTLLESPAAARLGFPSPLAMALALVDRQHDGSLLTSLWEAHLAFGAGLCVLLVALTRGRIEQLLRRG